MLNNCEVTVEGKMNADLKAPIRKKNSTFTKKISSVLSKMQFMTNNQIGTKIKERRESLGFSPKQVASELGITSRAYLNLEEGQVDIRASTFLVIKDFLKIEIGEIFGERGNSNSFHNSSENVQNLGVNNSFNIEVFAKCNELYERVITLEKELTASR